MNHKLVGFDRKIHLSWLDATADWAAQGLPAADIRKRLDRLLDGQVAGIGSHSARGKTMTVLMHVWVLVPDTLVPLRDDGLLLLRDRGEESRLPLHWGMCLAGYPFFRDVASTTGRLLSLQGSAALSQIVRRMTESWGTRSTVTRAVQRIVRSFVAWGVVMETEERGIIAPAPKIAAARRGSRRLAPRSRHHGRRQPSVPTPRACGFILVLSVRRETRGTRPRSSAAARSPPPSA